MIRDQAVTEGDLARYGETHSSTCRPWNTWTSLWFCPFPPLLSQYNPLMQSWKGTGWVGAQFTSRCRVEQLVVSPHCPHLGEVISASGWVLWTKVSGLLPWQLCDGNQSMVRWAIRLDVLWKCSLELNHWWRQPQIAFIIPHEKDEFSTQFHVN